MNTANSTIRTHWVHAGDESLAALPQVRLEYPHGSDPAAVQHFQRQQLALASPDLAPVHPGQPFSGETPQPFSVPGNQIHSPIRTVD
jgi:hypothetical protein